MYLVFRLTCGDTVQLVEQSLDTNLLNNAVRLKILHCALLPGGVHIQETLNNVIILLLSSQTVHRLVLPHPSRMYRSVSHVIATCAWPVGKAFHLLQDLSCSLRNTDTVWLNSYFCTSDPAKSLHFYLLWMGNIQGQKVWGILSVPIIKCITARYLLGSLCMIGNFNFVFGGGH